jgi:hypothetical protein
MFAAHCPEEFFYVFMVLGRFLISSTISSIPFPIAGAATASSFTNFILAFTPVSDLHFTNNSHG